MTTYWDGSYPPSVLRPTTGATAGTPGAWTPAGSAPPADLAAANALGYSGAAWTAGQYVVLGDASEAHWSGTAFVPGRATVVGAQGTSKRRKSSTKASEEGDDE